MDLNTGDMVIMSGEGTGEGTIERYEGKRTPAAIRSRLSRERAGGDRWADAWIETRRGVYGKLSKGLDELVDRRSIPAAAIRVNPAAILAAGHARPKSAANGAKGGRPAGKR
jgi:hypothetical protein